jgi:putative oxidoreductase
MRPYGLTALRLCVGTVFIAHGAQKLFGAWGGPGLAGTTEMLTSLGLTPAYPLAIVLAVTEFVGGILLVAGGATLWVSLALAVSMAVAIWKVHYQNGFFLNWSLTPNQGHGVEYNLVLIGALLALAIAGPGALSVDEWRHSNAEAQARGRARSRNL